MPIAILIHLYYYINMKKSQSLLLCLLQLPGRKSGDRITGNSRLKGKVTDMNLTRRILTASCAVFMPVLFFMVAANVLPAWNRHEKEELITGTILEQAEPVSVSSVGWKETAASDLRPACVSSVPSDSVSQAVAVSSGSSKPVSAGQAQVSSSRAAVSSQTPVSSRVLPVAAEVEAPGNQKIYEALSNKMKTMQPDETVKVWIWTKGVQQKEIYREFKNRTGMQYALNENTEAYKEELQRKLNEEILAAYGEEGFDQFVPYHDQISEEDLKKEGLNICGDYLCDPLTGQYVGVKRRVKMENDRIDAHIMISRTITMELQEHLLNQFFEETLIKDREVSFRSAMTGSVVAKLTGEDILVLAESPYVIGMDWYAK